MPPTRPRLSTTCSSTTRPCRFHVASRARVAGRQRTGQARRRWARGMTTWPITERRKRRERITTYPSCGPGHWGFGQSALNREQVSSCSPSSRLRSVSCAPCDRRTRPSTTRESLLSLLWPGTLRIQTVDTGAGALSLSAITAERGRLESRWVTAIWAGDGLAGDFFCHGGRG
jgi:hypothetical protein